MSHAPERKEKDCLNCGTIVQGKYCQHCGQENIVPKEGFWQLVIHFFYDITHFDSKFFDSLRFLLFRPGFLSAEYSRGRRARYLNPVKMYVFTSAVFFLIFFSMLDPGDTVKFDDNEAFTFQQRDSIGLIIADRVKKEPENADLLAQLSLLKDTSRIVRPLDLLPFQRDYMMVSTIGGDYQTMSQYDSIQASLPKNERDGWLRRVWNRRAISLNEKYHNDVSASSKKIADLVLHKLPYLLFISLPFFALILKLLYIRRKEFYYVDHGIFSVHHYIFSFILLLFIFLANELQDLSGWGIWSFVIAITILVWPVYLFIAMKRFYRQNGLKTFIKFVLLNIAGLVVLSFLLVFFFLFSVFQL